ncbi:MAG TPA: ATP-binding protein [Micropruina sp.]|nr:ATP-binding protein [Micropruina sp.]HMR21368.1 ATP-binding protein [Micropruina sp.]
MVVPESVPVWAVGISLVLAVLVAWSFSEIARWLLRGRASLGTAVSIVISVLGTAAGLLLTGWLLPALPLWNPLTIALALGLSIAGIAGYAAIAAHFQRPQRETLAELVRAGESSRVEFKSTARVNLHTGKRDDRMEQVVAKTVCAFLNADGGTLVIGVDDVGRPLGLDPDFATLKAPDADRFELWLRDHLTTTLGQNAAALVEVDFAVLRTDDGEALACRVTSRPSPRPVYLRPGRNAGPELWVRTGNSTRQLGVDEATEYVMHRWPLNLGSTIAAQFRAAVRFSEEH